MTKEEISERFVKNMCKEIEDAVDAGFTIKELLQAEVLVACAVAERVKKAYELESDVERFDLPSLKLRLKSAFWGNSDIGKMADISIEMVQGEISSKLHDQSDSLGVDENCSLEFYKGFKAAEELVFNFGLRELPEKPAELEAEESIESLLKSKLQGESDLDRIVSISADVIMSRLYSKMNTRLRLHLKTETSDFIRGFQAASVFVI